MESIEIASGGQATDFGNLTLARGEFGSIGTFTRAIFAGGAQATEPNTSTVIDYVEIASLGNAARFGDLSATTQRTTGAANTATRAVLTEGTSDLDQIVYFDPNTSGNAADFGNLTVSGSFVGAMNDPTRAVFAGRFTPSIVNTIDFVTIATTGNAQDFGDLSENRRSTKGASSSTRGTFAGGNTPTNTVNIDYVTIQSQGNSVDYGDLTIARDEAAAATNSVRALNMGGRTPALTSQIDQFNISSGGTATDYGDLVVANYSNSATSNSHGGLTDGYLGTRLPPFFGEGNSALFGGGQNDSGFTQTTSILNIETQGDSIDFGKISVGRSGAATGNETRAVYAGGRAPPTNHNIIEYFVYASKGNAADFGDTNTAMNVEGQHGGNSTRAILSGDKSANHIYTLEFASLGNSTDFGDLLAEQYTPTIIGSTTRSVIAGGEVGPAIGDAITYVTIAALGNSVDFGDLTTTRNRLGGASNGTRGVMAGGAPGENTIDYITIASTGNATDFGDLTQARQTCGGSNSTRGVFAGGITPTRVNTIDFITIASTGNATDFGDLIIPQSQHGGASNGHGGLDGTTATISGNRGLFVGGTAPSQTNVMNFIVISSTGNAADFGDLLGSANKNIGSMGSSTTRGVFSGGQTDGAYTAGVNVIQYTTLATTGNTADFGDSTITAERRASSAGGSSDTRGISYGGFNFQPSDTSHNVIEYITFTSLGNAIDFGDLLNSTQGMAQCGSNTRGVVAGGLSPGSTFRNVIQYITISSAGNATDFGDLISTTSNLAAAGNSTRGTFAGGYGPSPINIIQYITIASTGNATDFGDLLAANYRVSGTSNATRGVFGGGVTPNVRTNTMQYITIASTGNATDFGDLTAATGDHAASSDGHGGLQ
jgi:hypothetical protein